MQLLIENLIHIITFTLHGRVNAFVPFLHPTLLTKINIPPPLLSTTWRQRTDLKIESSIPKVPFSASK